MRDAYEREFRELLEGGIAAGEFRPVDPKLTAFAIIGIGHTVGRWYRPDGPLSPEQIAAQYVDFILAGLRAEPLGATWDSRRDARWRRSPVSARSRLAE